MRKNITSLCYRWSNHNGVICVLFLFTLCASFYRGYGVSDNYYAISQWLVTYESGFIKRALLGTLVQLEALSHLTGHSVLVLFFWVSNAFLVLLYLLTGLIMMRMLMLSRSAVFFIPYFLVGPLLRTQSVYIGYTDQVVMIIGIFITYSLICNKKIAVTVLVSLGILVHETLFVLVAPVILYGAVIKYHISSDLKNKIRVIKETAIILSIPALFFLALIGYQEFFMPKERILLYLSDMLTRQNPPYYRVDMISEIYTFTFMDWYLMHKDDAFSRLTAWGGPAGYVSVIFFVAVSLHALYILSEKKINNNWWVLFLSLLLISSPLILHLLVVDHDRVWNIVTWVSFLAIWVFLEKYGKDFETSGRLAIPFFLFTLFGVLFPQARSDVTWSVLFYIYIPILIWYLIWGIGHFSQHDRIIKNNQ